MTSFSDTVSEAILSKKAKKGKKKRKLPLSENEIDVQNDLDSQHSIRRPNSEEGNDDEESINDTIVRPKKLFKNEEQNNQKKKKLKKVKKKDTVSEVDSNEEEDDLEGSLHSKDPFFLHFTKNLAKHRAKEIEDFSLWKTSFIEWPTLKRIVVEMPTLNPIDERPKSKKLLLQEEEDIDFPTIGVVPETPSRKPSKTLSKSFLRQKLLSKIPVETFSPLQSELLTIFSRYIDLHYPYSTYEKWDEIRTVYALHCVNHVLKTRKQVTQHNNKLNHLKKSKKGNSDVLFLDQGFTRPKVLILLPFKHSAYEVVKKILFLMDVEVKNRKRFESDFRPPDDEGKPPLKKPQDFNKIFEGDIKEDFKIGLKITKRSVKLYANFSESDVIIASPLGLRFMLEVAEDDEKKDFLSSIEILVMDQADIFLMQNWEHILIIRDSLNRVPSNLQQVIEDLYRIRRWCMDGLASLYRQTLIFSSTLTDYNRVFIKKTRNFAGKMEVLNLSSSGSLEDVTVVAELILQRVKTSPSETAQSPDAQFAHFTQILLPQLRRKKQTHTLIYVPDYCDYVRLVSYFKEDRGTNVSTINEYMMEENKKVAKARTLFFLGKRKFLIYTERFHFYRRYKIKGVQHVIFYGLPTYPHFFSEICNFMADEYQNPKAPPMLEQHSILAPYQKFDATKLVGIIGTERAEQILSSDKSIHKCETRS